PVAQERRFLQALVPDREEPPDAPRFRAARRLDPLEAEPLCSRGSDLPICSVVIFIALGPAVGDSTKSVPFSINSQEVFITAISSLVYRNLPARSPHREYGGRLTSRQQVILCTWPLSFGNLASASWQ